MLRESVLNDDNSDKHENRFYFLFDYCRLRDLYKNIGHRLFFIGNELSGCDLINTKEKYHPMNYKEEVKNDNKSIRNSILPKNEKPVLNIHLHSADGLWLVTYVTNKCFSVVD